MRLPAASYWYTTYEPSYDGFDRLVKLRYPNPTTTNQSSTTDYEQSTFDAYGRMTQERRRSGESFLYSYDNLGRVTLRDAPGAQPDVSFGYDLFGRTTSTSQSGNALTTVYDALSRVTSVSSSVLGAVSYQYDAAGRRTQLTYPDGFYVTYGYDNTSALTGVYENGSGTLATLAYDNLGRRTSLTRGNGVVTSYTFDALSRLEHLGAKPERLGLRHDVHPRLQPEQPDHLPHADQAASRLGVALQAPRRTTRPTDSTSTRTSPASRPGTTAAAISRATAPRPMDTTTTTA